MKKYLLLFLIILFVIIIIPNEEEEFRIRVIANSDSVSDQIVKMKVVNALLQEIDNFDKNNIKVELNNNINTLKKSVERNIGNEKYKISIGKTRFPPKELNGEIIKGGRYDSLVVVIGDGKGKNWWSLLNSDYRLGFEDVPGDEVKFKFYFFSGMIK